MGKRYRQVGASAKSSELTERVFLTSPPFYRIDSKMNHVERNVTDEIVALLIKAAIV